MKTSDRLKLPFGFDQCWELEAKESVTSILQPNAEPLDDVASAVSKALQEPIEFPSLDQSLVSGDSVVFAIDPFLPAMGELLPAILNWFVERGCSAENMQLVFAGRQNQLPPDLEKQISTAVGGEISIEVHDPDNEEKVAYVAANSDSDPIYMNRTLVDADVVIPVTCARATSAIDFLGAYSLYPLLSDRTTRGAFYSLSGLGDPKAHEDLTDLANQAAMWAGFLVSIQVIPAGNDQVAEIHAGLLEPLEKHCEQRMDELWKTNVSESNLTVALIDGGPAHQNWLGISRALHVANRCTTDGGAIVLCTQANETMGKSMSRLRRDQAADDAALAKKLNKDNADDSLAAALVHQATRDKHLYLVSGMRSSSLENIGVGALQENRELQHLVDQFDRTNIFGSAQHRHVVMT